MTKSPKLTSLPCVVDTNVGVMANLKHETSADCQLACIEALEDIHAAGHIVLDDNDLIFDEYRRHLSLSGQPGVGDAFMKWVHNNLHNPERCTLVAIGGKEADRPFDAFPTLPELEGVDPSDKKFFATANAHPKKPRILQAVDSKWWGWKDDLTKAGISVEFLCEKEIRALHAKKARS